MKLKLAFFFVPFRFVFVFCNKFFFVFYLSFGFFFKDSCDSHTTYATRFFYT